MVATIGVASVFPLMFVARVGSRLPGIALAVLAVHVPVALLGQVLAGLYGLAAALAVSTGAGLVLMLAALHAAGPALRRLVRTAVTVTALGAIGFVPFAPFLEPAPAAVLGLVAYVILVAATRPRGLRSAWHYLRALT
jgi:hypothetical protein